VKQTKRRRDCQPPIEPRFLIREMQIPVRFHFSTALDGLKKFDRIDQHPDREPYPEVKLVICVGCESEFAMEWTENGEPIYAGGMRLVRWKAKQDGSTVWGYGPCGDCKPGRLRASSMQGKLTPQGYPNNRAMELAMTDDIDPWQRQETREIRDASEGELEGWRRQWQAKARQLAELDDNRPATVGDVMAAMREEPLPF